MTHHDARLLGELQDLQGQIAALQRELQSLTVAGPPRGKAAVSCDFPHLEELEVNEVPLPPWQR